MRNLKAAKRQEEILRLLSSNGAMKMTELADYFHVSRETIRRDLITLNEKGLVKKWFGGAISAHEKQVFNILELNQKIELNSAVKAKIAQKGLEFIPPHAAIFIDNGSTTLCLAKFLSQMSGYTIITASTQVINACVGSDNKLVMCGGIINPLTLSATGSPTVDFLKQLKTDIAFFGTDGFKLNDGPTGNDINYTQVKKTALKNTQTSIVLSDSSKATYSSMIQFADWKDIDCLITDSNLEPAVKKRIENSTDIFFADE